MTTQPTRADAEGRSGAWVVPAFVEDTNRMGEGIEAFICRCRAERVAQGLAAQVEDESVLDAVATILDGVERRPGAA